MNTLVEMINSMEVREDDESFKNAVDYMFDGLARRSPQHFAVRQYAKYKLASGKTARSILISCGAQLAPFDIPQLREIMSYDEMELDKRGTDGRRLSSSSATPTLPTTLSWPLPWPLSPVSASAQSCPAPTCSGCVGPSACPAPTAWLPANRQTKTPAFDRVGSVFRRHGSGCVHL